MPEPWKIHHIKDELESSFNLCQTQFERSMWRVIVRKDVERILNGRKPTPGEQSILEQYGI